MTIDPRWRRTWRVLGILGLIAVPVVCLLPMPDLGVRIRHTDKIEHLLGYFVATWWWAQLAPDRSRLFAQGGAFVIYGMAIEMLQALVPWRSGNDPWDVLANTVGVVLATVVAMHWRVFRSVPQEL